MHKKSRKPLIIKTFRLPMNGGDEGIRTLDLSDANRTLSQLSYAPIFSIFGVVNADARINYAVFSLPSYL